jgi:hypothetical protein
MGMLWFVEYFPLFVVLPAGSVLFGGFTTERSKRKQKKISN